MIKKILLVLGVITLPFLSTANSWDSQIDSILNNIEQQSLKYKHKPIISKTKILTERLFTTHDKSYLKMEVESNKGRAITQEVYYSNNEFLATMYKSEANLKEYNLYFQRGWIYQWHTNEKTGVKYPADISDLIHYVGYSINPLGLVSTFYEDYLEFPETFKVNKEDAQAWTELIFTVRRYSYKSLLIDLENVWFHGFKTFDPDSLAESTFWINTPQPYVDLPKHTLAEFEEVMFTLDDNKSLKQYMKYITVIPGKPAS